MTHTNLISRFALARATDAVFGRGLMGFALAIPVAIALGLQDSLRLAAAIAALGGVSAGIAIGAQLVAGRLTK